MCYRFAITERQNPLSHEEARRLGHVNELNEAEHWARSNPCIPTAEQLRPLERSQPDVEGVARAYPLTQSGHDLLVRLVLIIKRF